MNTKMVIDDWQRTPLTTVEEDVNAVAYVLDQNTTGAYYDGDILSKAIPQVYNAELRKELKNITWEGSVKYL